MKKKFESIMKQKTDIRRKNVTFDMVKKAISARSKRKAGDKVGWKVEWLIEGDMK